MTAMSSIPSVAAEVRNKRRSSTTPMVRTAVPGIGWPALPGREGSLALSLLHQLEHSQWWSPDVLLQAQFRQLGAVLAHADETVAFYRDRFRESGFDPRAPLTMERWRCLPILTRRDIQDAGDVLLSTRIPAGHGGTHRTKTSGSTGQPVQIVWTAMASLFWRVLTLRDHLWHRRDLTAKLCAIRAMDGGASPKPDAPDRPGWGPATDSLFRTGRSAALRIDTDLSVQANWLVRHAPDYLLTYPSNLQALTEHIRRHRLHLPSLREIRTIGETLSTGLRAACQDVWGVKVVDLYSSQEAGYIALECPDQPGTYHAQSEDVLVEIVDDQGRPCAAGEIGRILVTTLHNFAMPLLRYEIRDYAEAGGKCTCGRGLPTIARILGRQRNMLVMPNGEKRWPLVGLRDAREIAPVRQFQAVQRDLENIEVRFVVDRPLTGDEESRLRDTIVGALAHPFNVTFVYLDAFPPTAGGKFEEFVCEIGR